MGAQTDDTLPSEGQLPSGRSLAPGIQAAGRYRIVRLIGTGGMGEVYEAEDLIVGGRVALKTLLPELASSTTAIERFRREIALARKVSSPHVCRLHDVGTHEGRLFITMELLAGSTLADRIKAGPLSVGEADAIARQLVAGLSALHASGIVHRDFKPSNVMLVGDRAVITDFGLARSTTEANATLTLEGGLLGTPTYMAPEQVESRPATAASDIYALGVVLFELATGTVPFREDTAMATATARLQREPPKPSSIRSSAARWDERILRCLARDPSARYQRVEDVLDAPLPMRRRWLTMVVTSSIALAGGAIWWTLREPEDVPEQPQLVEPTPTPAPLRLVAVIPVEGPGPLEDPWRLALSFDIHDALATTDLPILAFDGGASYEAPEGTAALLAMNPEPARAAWKIEGVDAVVRTSIRHRKTSTIALDVTVERRGRALERFAIERPASDAGSLAMDAARKIATTLGSRPPREAPDASIDATAYERYGSGLAQIHVEGKSDILDKLAVDRPDILRASARLGMSYVTRGQHRNSEKEVFEMFTRGDKLFDQVLARDPDHPVALMSRAVIVRHRFQWSEAERLGRRARQIAPRLHRATIELGFTLYLQGKFDEGLELMTQAFESNPVAPNSIVNRVWALYYGRHFGEAVKLAEKVRDGLDDERKNSVLSFEALACVELARFDEAYAIAKRMPLDNPYWLANSVIVFAATNHRDEAIALRTQIDDQAGPFMGALMDDALGRTDRALDQLERAIAARDIHSQFLRMERFSTAIRSHPRFQALMKRTGF